MFGGLKRKVLVLTVVAVSMHACAGAFNPYKGMRQREEVFEFVKKPEVRKEDGAYVIEFEVKGRCDVTVWAESPDGKVLSHIASGVLGENAPYPFQQGTLRQKIRWDGKDDQGRPVPADTRLVVALGLRAAYGGQLCWDPYYFPGGNFGGVRQLACDDKGLLYVFWSRGVKVFDHGGKYVKTIAPHPGFLEPKDLSAYRFYPTTYGDKVILSGNRYGPFCGVLSGGVGTCAWSSALGKMLAFFLHGSPYQPSRLLMFGAHGELRSEDVVRFVKDRRWSGYLGKGAVHLAATVDGKVVYVAVAASPGRRHRNSVNLSNAVYRLPAEEIKGPFYILKERRPFAGEPGVSGDDEKHFNGIGGVAVDGKGRVYVSDRGNDRIQVFGSDGSLLRSIPVPSPGQVYCHPRTGNIYCMSGKMDRRGRGLKILKLSPEGKVLASFDGLVPSGGVLDPKPPVFCLDAASDPPALWVRPVCGFRYAPQPFRVEDRGKSFQKVFTMPPPRPHQPWGVQDARPRMALDRRTGELYVVAGTLCRYTPDGKFDEGFYKKIGGKFRPESVAVGGPRGLVHARTGNGLGGYAYGQFVVRFGRDGSLVPFEKGVKAPKLLPGVFKDFTAIWTGESTESNVHQKGFAVAPNGDVYAVVTGVQKKWLEDRRGGMPYSPEKVAEYLALGQKGRVGLVRTPLVRVFDEHGREKIFNALPGCPYIHGIRVDRHGFVYVAALNVRPEGVKIPDGLKEYMKFHLTMGSVLKLGDGSGKLPVARFWREKDSGRPQGPNNLYDAGGWGNRYSKVWCDQFRWGYFGQTGLGVNCSCHHTRFDLDDYSRVFVPAMHLFSIMVLDANGNKIARIGRYGNADHRGKDSYVVDPETGMLRPRRKDDPPSLKSPFAEPEVAFAWVRAVAAGDDVLYAMDYDNMRILRVKLGYAVVEKVPME